MKRQRERKEDPQEARLRRRAHRRLRIDTLTWEQLDEVKEALQQCSVPLGTIQDT